METMCIRCGLGAFPFLLAVLSVVTFLITYVISRIRNDTSWFPTISDTADRRPESNVFGLLFNFCALLALVTTFVRYLQLRHDADWNERDRALVIRLNKLAVVLGVASSLGGSIVANFQEDVVSFIHIIGALLIFVGGILYCWVQSFISYKMSLCGLITRSLFILRVAIAFAATIFFATCATATSYASVNGVRYHLASDEPRLRWNPTEKHYVYHVIGDVSEWLMALTLLSFLFTYFGEFRFIKMKIVVSRRTQHPVPLATGMGSNDSINASLYV